MDGSKLLSDLVVFSKYAKYLEEENRRESWEEICDRNMEMHIKSFPKLKEEIKTVYEEFIKTKKVLPSMRSAQFAGKPIELSPNRIFNCAYCPVDHYKTFSEVMFLLLGGTGVGFSVQYKHIEKLPQINKPKKTRRYVIGDSIEGWAEAVNVLIKAYMCGKSLPVFDFSDIRKKGSRLVTSGGKAPGPDPLKNCLFKLKIILDSVEDGEQLSSLQVHDMICHIADAVLAGGIRRAALISFFSLDDEDMLTCKYGSWWELNPQRGRANNSAVILRHRVTEKDFLDLWKKIEKSGSGEPGFYLTNDNDWLSNPCCEIALRPYQFCNLTTINGASISGQEDFNNRAKAAAFIGTLQASYTDFHYLRPIWKKTTEKDALIGVSCTGIAAMENSIDLEEASKKVVEENKRIADIIGINPAARTTCVKPEGTASCVVMSSSGIHGFHDNYYIRRIRFNKEEPVARYLEKHLPEVCEDDQLIPNTLVVSLPIKAPEGAKTRLESPIELLERVKLWSTKWIAPGHNKGNNTHNVSATISIKEDEWEDVGAWMWKNREYYNGLSVLPFDGGSYVQAPFETIDKETYEELIQNTSSWDLKNVKEYEDLTDLKGEVACAGGKCEI